VARFRGEKLKDIRIQRGLSQRDIPGVGQDTVWGIEAGLQTPRPSTLRKLAEALEVDVDDFFEDATVPKEAAPSLAAEAVANARRFREDAKERLDMAIYAWKYAKEAGAGRQERQRFVDAIARIFNEAHAAEWELRIHMEEGMASMGVRPGGELPPAPPGEHYAPNAYWEEIREASRFYGELREHARERGFNIKDPEPGQLPAVEEIVA
jgi:transcriptional regulator with XRE-family HTH domain